jgi:hypothetical protein
MEKGASTGRTCIHTQGRRAVPRAETARDRCALASQWRQHARLGLVKTDAKVFHMLPPFAEVILTELPVQCVQSGFSKPRDKRVFRLETSPRDGCLSPHGDLVCGVAP